MYKPQEPDYSIKLANALPLDEGQDKPKDVDVKPEKLNEVKPGKSIEVIYIWVL